MNNQNKENQEISTNTPAQKRKFNEIKSAFSPITPSRIEGAKILAVLKLI